MGFLIRPYSHLATKYPNAFALKKSYTTKSIIRYGNIELLWQYRAYYGNIEFAVVLPQIPVGNGYKNTAAEVESW